MFDDDKDDFREGVGKWAENLRDQEDKGKDRSFSENLGEIADQYRSIEDRGKNRTDEENLGEIADQSRSVEERGCRDVSKNINEIANRYRDIDEKDTRCNRIVDGKTINDHFTSREYNDNEHSGYSPDDGSLSIFAIGGWILLGLFIISLMSGVFSQISNGNIKEDPSISLKKLPPISRVEKLIDSAKSFNVIINYDADITDKLNELGARYANDGSKSINSQTFPSQERGTSQVEINLVSNYLLAEYTLDEIPFALNQLGYRSATIQEIIFLGIQYKNQIISNQEGNSIYVFAQESKVLSSSNGDIGYCSIYYKVISGNISPAVGYLSEDSIRGCGGKLPSVLFAVVKK